MFYHHAPRESAVSKEIFYFRIGIKLFQIIVFLDNNRFVFLIIVVITVKAFRQKFLRHFTHHDYYIDLPIISLHFIVVVKANKLISKAVSMLLEFRFGRCVKEDLSWALEKFDFHGVKIDHISMRKHIETIIGVVLKSYLTSMILLAHDHFK